MLAAIAGMSLADEEVLTNLVCNPNTPASVIEELAVEVGETVLLRDPQDPYPLARSST